jgi:lipoprotein NlpI
MIQMVNGIYQSKKENYEAALESFRKSLDLDKNREYQTLKKMNNKK